MKIENDLAVLPSYDRWHSRIPICGAQLRERGENARQRDREEWACSQVVSDMCKGTPNPQLRSPFQSSGAIL